MQKVLAMILIMIYTILIAMIIGIPLYRMGHGDGYKQAIRFYDQCGDSRQ